MKMRFLDSCYTYMYQGRSLAFQQDPINMWFPYTPPEDNDTSDANNTSTGNDTSDANNTSTGNDTFDANNTSTGNDTSGANNTSTGNETLSFNSSNDSTNETSKNNDTLSDDISSNDDSTELERRFFYVYFTTADESTYTSDVLVDGASFISAVGGNLGLFLGFSFLGLLFPLYEKAERTYRKSVNKR